MAAGRAEAWGYPRRITQQEVKTGIWFSYGDLAYIWYMKGPIEDSLQVHCAANPERKVSLGNERNMTALGVIAEVIGAVRLYSVIPPQVSGFESMRRYLRMHGWKEDQWGCYVDLGGV